MQPKIVHSIPYSMKDTELSNIVQHGKPHRIKNEQSYTLKRKYISAMIANIVKSQIEFL